MLAISVWEAVRDAVAHAGGNPSQLQAPCTAEHVLLALKAVAVKPEQV